MVGYRITSDCPICGHAISNHVPLVGVSDTHHGVWLDCRDCIANIDRQYEGSDVEYGYPSCVDIGLPQQFNLEYLLD